jgi:hypothetical protein
LVLRDAHVGHPEIGDRIARTEPQGLSNVSFRFLGATYENLAKSDGGMGLGKISIQIKRMFTFGDALCRPLCLYVDKSQVQERTSMVRDRRQSFGQL